MKEATKIIAMFALIILSNIGMYIGINENKKKDEARYQAIVEAFEQVNTAFAEQQKEIEQYKRDCENITSKVINGEW